MNKFDTTLQHPKSFSHRFIVMNMLALYLSIGISLFASSVAHSQTTSFKERTMKAQEQLRDYRYEVQSQKQKDNMKTSSFAPSNVGISINSAASTSSTVFFYENFEASAHTWTTELYGGATDNLWHGTTLNSSSATHSWWPGIDIQGNYATGRRINTAMKSASIALTGATGPIKLLFAENFCTELGWDYCMVDISTNSGSTWTHLRGGYGSAPSGYSGGWIITSLDLTPYAGQTIILRFLFDTGDEHFNDFPGWFVDDIIIFDQGGMVTGKKFFDVNNNGVKDLGERGVKDWKITATGPIVLTTTTNYRGKYWLPLPLGSYTITEEFQPNWTQKYPLSGHWDINLTKPDTLVDSIHFGNYTQASFINGMKFHDLNHNGVKDPGDTALTEWRIVLADTNGNEINFDKTDSLGQYSLYVFQPGRYIIKEVPKAGWVQSYPPNEYYTITIPNLNTVSNGNDFGNYYSPNTNAIMGQKFNDRNRNHLKENTEEGVAGFKIQLMRKGNGNNYSDYRQRTTDSSGFYEFLSLPADTYKVKEIPQQGWWQSYPDSLYIVALNSDSTIDNIDFGNYQIAPSILGGIKFNDLNDNGVQDQGEAGLSGWRIDLNGTTYFNSSASFNTTTDPSGNYSFSNVWPGTYTVSEVWRSNWRQTLPASLLPYFVIVGPEEAITGKNFGNHVDSTFSTAFRTFLPESLALAVDKDTKHKPVKAAPDRNEFTIKLQTIDASFADSSIRRMKVFYTNPLIPGTVTVSIIHYGTDTVAYPSSTISFEGKFKRLNIAFDPPVQSVKRVVVHAFARKPELQGLLKFYTTYSGGSTLQDGNSLRDEDLNVIRWPMPNAINLLQQVGAGLRIGLGGPHSVVHPSYKEVQKSLLGRADALHLGDPRCLDVFSGPAKSSIKKQQKFLTPTQHNNKFFAEAIALKANIRGSDFGNMPGGFGNLIFDEGTGIGPAHPLNGLSIREIAAALDSFMSSYKDIGAVLHQCTMPGTLAGLSADTLFAKIRMIDSAFSGPMDTTSFATGLVIKEVRPLTDVPFLRLDPSSTKRLLFPEERMTQILPDKFTLFQNYPNPFNPTTQIEFTLPFQSIVTLKIYNMLGQEVATLMSKELMDNGSQEIEFNASNLPSGVYFYRIVAETTNEEGITTGERFVSVKKMVLVK